MHVSQYVRSTRWTDSSSQLLKYNKTASCMQAESCLGLRVDPMTDFPAKADSPGLTSLAAYVRGGGSDERRVVASGGAFSAGINKQGATRGAQTDS